MPPLSEYYYALEQICWDCQQRLPADRICATLSMPEQVIHSSLAGQTFSTQCLVDDQLMPLFEYQLGSWRLSIQANATVSDQQRWLQGLSPQAIEKSIQQLQQPHQPLADLADTDVFQLLQSLQDLTRYMDPSQTEHGFCEQVVRTATSHLGIDRMAIFIIGPEPQRMRGTWGTNDLGEVVDRSDYSDNIPGNHPMVSRALAERDLVLVNAHATLFFNQQPVGLGWNAMIAIWSEGQALGWIAADNLLNRREFNQLNQESLKFLGAIVGSIISRIRSREALLNLNRQLEQKVSERTQDLSNSLEHLKQAQDKLVESEKLSALGALVAGVAHEVNTPLGISVTASSVLEETLTSLNYDFQNGRLSKTLFSDYLDQAQQNNKLLSNNLQRAAKLIADFKKTAVDQHSDHYLRFNLRDSLDALIASLHPETRKHQAQLHLDCHPQLFLMGYPGLVSQMMTNLIMNSLHHGFDRPVTGNNRIQINVSEQPEKVLISYQDNGVGIEVALQQKIFEPFYTTKRQQGGSGLGLSILHNLVQKLGGSLQLNSEPGQGACFDIQLPKVCVNFAQPR